MYNSIKLYYYELIYLCHKILISYFILISVKFKSIQMIINYFQILKIPTLLNK